MENKKQDYDDEGKTIDLLCGMMECYVFGYNDYRNDRDSFVQKLMGLLVTYSYETCEKASKDILYHEKFFPSIATFKEYLDKHDNKNEKPKNDK